MLGEVDDLLKSKINVGQINSMKYETLPNGMECTTMIRYNDSGALSKIYPDHDSVFVEFEAEVRGVAPGQSAVFYDGDDVIGGGIIQASLG